MIMANIAASMYPILLPVYLSEMGASVQQIGLVFTLASVAMLVLQIFGGWVSDSIGRLKAIAIGSAGGIIGFIALGLAPNWQWMTVAIMAISFPRSLVGPSFGAFLAENSKEENRGKLYGVTDTIYQITGVVGPALGGFLAGLWGFKGMLFVSAGIYIVAAGLRVWMATTMRSPKSAKPQELSTSSFKSSVGKMWGMMIGGGLLTWLLLTDGVRDIAFRLSGELQPLYMEQIGGLGVEQIGLLGSIFSISMMFTPILSGKMSDKYGERVPISLGFLMLFLSMLLLRQHNRVHRLCTRLDHRWLWRRSAQPGVPVVGFQSRTAQYVGYLQRSPSTAASACSRSQHLISAPTYGRTSHPGSPSSLPPESRC